jgi:glucokinase
MNTYIVFDIGGTNMRVARATDDALEEVSKVPTPQDPVEGMERLVALVKSVSGGASISAIAGCMPGELEGNSIKDMPNIPRWVGLRPSDVLSNAFGAPVSIVNDAGCVGLGEYRFGAGAGSSIMVYVTVSTGVGGARITDGTIDRSAIGYHPGKQILNGETLENQVSGKAVQKKFGIHPKDLDSVEERDKLADILSVGLFNSCVHWSPDTIVVGGSMIVGINPIPLERVRADLTRRIEPFARMPRLVMATLKDDGGLQGARHLAMQMSR